MVALASTGVVLPIAEAEQMWMPAGREQRVTQLSFLEFMRARRTPHDRPTPTGIGEATAKRYRRLVIQTFRDIGLPAPGRYEHSLPPQASGPEYWEAGPPWERIYDRFRGGHPRYENHRKAFQWYASLFGLNESALPKFMRHTWATEDDVHEAQSLGEMKEREKFLTLPAQFETLMASHPYLHTNEVRAQMNRRHRREARYLDAMWHVGVFVSFYTLRRAGELAALQMENIVDGKGIVGLRQQKKRGRPVNPSIPEQWVFDGHPRKCPSLNWYVRKIRPMAPGGRSTAGPVFLTPGGTPYTNDSWRDFIGEGMRRALGQDLSAHSLRRGGATWRHQYGWSLERIALLMGDKKDTVEKSYIDWPWIISTNGPLVHRTRTPTPPVPMLRSNGKPLEVA